MRPYRVGTPRNYSSPNLNSRPSFEAWFKAAVKAAPQIALPRSVVATRELMYL